MVKKILFLFCSLVMFSCTQNDEPEPLKIEADKTIFMYLPWTGGSDLNSKGKPIYMGLYDLFNENIKSVERAIETLGSTQKTRTLVLISDKPSSAYLFEILYQNGKCTRDTLHHYVNLQTNCDGLSNVISKIKQISPTRTYSMIMGAHGSGWIPKNKTRRRTRSIGGLTASEQFDISEIADAIAMNGIKLQFLCFDDCYMSNVEVAYDLKDVTRYIIASTSEVMDTGIPYETVYRYMASGEPNYEAIVKGFLSYYSAPNPYPYGSLSVIDCNYVEDMARVIRQFNHSGTDAPSGAEVAPQDPYEMENHNYYDLGDYLRKYNLKLSSQGKDSIRYNDALINLVPYKIKTEKLYTMYFGGSSYTVRAYSGITISDPATSPSTFKNKLQTRWWKATH